MQTDGAEPFSSVRVLFFRCLFCIRFLSILVLSVMFYLLLLLWPARPLDSQGLAHHRYVPVRTSQRPGGRPFRRFARNVESKARGLPAMFLRTPYARPRAIVQPSQAMCNHATLTTARLAQSAERKALNLVVVGSSPTVGVFANLNLGGYFTSVRRYTPFATF